MRAQVLQEFVAKHSDGRYDALLPCVAIGFVIVVGGLYGNANIVWAVRRRM